MCVGDCGFAAYLAIFRMAAASLALPALADDASMYDAANVTTTVAYHARQRPLLHGTKVNPSGLIPSEPRRTAGSTEYMVDDVIDLLVPCTCAPLAGHAVSTSAVDASSTRTIVDLT